MLRKVFKSGNSLVISLPKELLAPIGLRSGTNVSVELDEKNRQILIRPAEFPLAIDFSEEFARQVNDFIIEYRQALDALARK